ncbi:MAG: beta-hydroxyacyl-ACP dehydratase [Phycisphaerae bacterium]|nr:beta-hydroxyacyl-ACP dehydratase [Phycisphaerae bacterium]
MKFVLIDRISEFEPGRRIVAHKAVSLAEEYLGDHFPTFPVLPGVLMVEAMVQASAWIVREKLDFEVGVVVLKEARNVTYKSFLVPGEVLTVESICKEITPAQSIFVASGTTQDRPVVKAKLVLSHLRLADLDPGLEETDARLRSQQRAMFNRLWHVGRTAGATVG